MLLGDLVSIYLAVLRGVDPTPVEVIERLKDELARERESPERLAYTSALPGRPAAVARRMAHAIS